MNRIMLLQCVVIFLALSQWNVAADTIFPLKPSPDGRYLVDGKNTPFFYHADTAWAITKKLSKSEVGEYLDDRRAKGFTAIHVHTVSKEQGPTANRDGQEPFVPIDDITKPNEAYWQNVDYILNAAKKRNMLVAMSALWIRPGGADKEGWRYQLTTGNAKPYGQFLGQRYKGFDNLVWILGGDANPIELTPAIDEMAKGIQEFAPRQLITVHNRSDHSSSAFFESAAWLGINMAYTYGETYIHTLGEWNRLGRPRPIVLGESGYEEESNDRRGGEPLRMRRQAYGAILAGALGGHAFGQKHIWRFDNEWRKSLESPASKQMTHLKELFTSRAWHGLRPDQFNELVVGERTLFGKAEYPVAARAGDKSFALVYLPTNRAITIDLDMVKRPVAAKWFDPTDGSYKLIENIAQSGRLQFTPPPQNAGGETDFLLVIETKKS